MTNTTRGKKDFVEMRTALYGKQSFPADMLIEARYDSRHVIPAWKWKILRLFL